MKKIVLFMAIALAVSLPAGFAVGQVIQGAEAEQPASEHRDPDPSTDPVALHREAEEAYEAGDQAALKKASEALREEEISRMEPEEREAAESAPPQAPVPAGTLAYIPESMPQTIISHCEKHLEERHDPLCELILLHAEGKVRSGAFSPEQVREALGPNAELGEGGAR